MAAVAVRDRALVALFGLALAALGTLPAVDAIVPWVFGIVDSVAWGDVWRPVYNPEPMDTYAYRPLSVVVLKALRLLLGDQTVVMTALHGLVFVAFGQVALSALHRAGFARGTALLATLSTLCMPSLLFSGWIVVEFDLVGATFALAAMLCLPRDGVTGGRPALFWTLALLAMTTKETSALQLLAFLVADAWTRRLERGAVRRVLVYVGLLLLVTAPMHLAPRGSQSAFTLFSDGFQPFRVAAILLHTTCQLLFLVAPVGAAALALQAVPSRLRACAGALFAVLLWALSPVLRTYSHFEAVVFSSSAMAMTLALGVLLGLVALALRRRPPASEGAATFEHAWGVTVLLTLAGYALAPVLLSFARADVSARIFAACVPLLHAVVWRECGRLWASGRVGRVPAALLGVAFAGFALSAGASATLFHRTRLLVEDAVKLALAADIRMPCPALLATNAVQMLTTEELTRRGARLGACAWIETTTDEPAPGASFDAFVSAGGVHIDRGQDAYLLVQTARSTMTPSQNAVLAGDFEWTRDVLPESDDDLFTAYQRLIYEVETDIESLFRREGRLVGRASLPYVQLPLFLTEIPRRLWLGVPLVERYDYVAAAYRVDAREPGYTPPGGRVRGDHTPTR